MPRWGVPPSLPAFMNSSHAFISLQQLHSRGLSQLNQGSDTTHTAHIQTQRHDFCTRVTIILGIDLRKIDLDERKRTISPEIWQQLSMIRMININQPKSANVVTTARPTPNSINICRFNQERKQDWRAFVLFSHNGTDSLGKSNNLLVFDSVNQAAVLMKGLLCKCLRSVQIRSYNRFGRMNKSLWMSKPCKQ